MIGGRQHILDGGVMPSDGGIISAAYFWKAAFFVGVIIPSKAGVIRLGGGIAPSEGGRILCRWRDASIWTC